MFTMRVVRHQRIIFVDCFGRVQDEVKQRKLPRARPCQDQGLGKQIITPIEAVP